MPSEEVYAELPAMPMAGEASWRAVGVVGPVSDPLSGADQEEAPGPGQPRALPCDWAAFNGYLQATGSAATLGCHFSGVFGTPRDLMGAERILTAVIEEYRRKYPRLGIIGGLDKQTPVDGKDAMDRETKMRRSSRARTGART